jgi:hypothetical protein
MNQPTIHELSANIAVINVDLERGEREGLGLRELAQLESRRARMLRELAAEEDRFDSEQFAAMARKLAGDDPELRKLAAAEGDLAAFKAAGVKLERLIRDGKVRMMSVCGPHSPTYALRHA